ncbi:MAG: hypothetical protein IJ003_02215 [Candidatus Gastranaerophilales bacterium]|nr:hypothetical protein [Candidatus Gastranaerophilales bacterium]
MIPAISFGSVYKINQSEAQARKTHQYIWQNLSSNPLGYVAINKPVSLFDEIRDYNDSKFVSFGEDKNYILTEEDADKYHELRTELEEDWERYHDYYKGDDLCDIMCEEANERFNNKLRKLIRNSSVYELDVSYDKNAPDVPKFTVLG